MPSTRRGSGKSPAASPEGANRGRTRTGSLNPHPPSDKPSTPRRSRVEGGPSGKAGRSPRGAEQQNEERVTTEVNVKTEQDDRSLESESVRRSGRKRVLSSRLQDMEVTLSTPKGKKRSSNQTDSPDKPARPLKKVKLAAVVITPEPKECEKTGTEGKPMLKVKSVSSAKKTVSSEEVSTIVITPDTTPSQCEGTLIPSQSFESKHTTQPVNDSTTDEQKSQEISPNEDGVVTTKGSEQASEDKSSGSLSQQNDSEGSCPEVKDQFYIDEVVEDNEMDADSAGENLTSFESKGHSDVITENHSISVENTSELLPTDSSFKPIVIKPDGSKTSTLLLAYYLRTVVQSANVRKVQLKTEKGVPPGGSMSTLAGGSPRSGVVMQNRPGSLIKRKPAPTHSMKQENTQPSTSSVKNVPSQPETIATQPPGVATSQQSQADVLRACPVSIEAPGSQPEVPGLKLVGNKQREVGTHSFQSNSVFVPSSSDASVHTDSSQPCSGEAEISSLPEGTQLTVKYLETSDGTQPEVVCVGFPLEGTPVSQDQSEAQNTESLNTIMSEPGNTPVHEPESSHVHEPESTHFNDDQQIIVSEFQATSASDTSTSQCNIDSPDVKATTHNSVVSVLPSEQNSITTTNIAPTESSMLMTGEATENSDMSSSIQLEQGEVKLSIIKPATDNIVLEAGEVGTNLDSSIELEPGEVSYNFAKDVPNTSVLIVDAGGNVMCSRSLRDFTQAPGGKIVIPNQKEEKSAKDTPAHIDLTTETAPFNRGTRAGYINGDETIEILPDGKIKCKLCPYVTDKKTNWYKHKKKHLGMKNYECDICSYKCSTSSNLARHLMVHQDIRRFKCDECGLMFRQKIHAIRHKQYKHEKKKLKCDLCDYRCSSYQPEMVQHIQRKHQSEEEFSCQDCDYTTVSRRDLQQHRKFHLKGPELKLFCEYCSFVTDCQSRLKRHVITHTKEKPFRCSLCTYQASQKEHVLRHMRTKHRKDLGLPEPDIKEKRRRQSKGKSGSQNSEEVVIIQKRGVTVSMTEEQLASQDSTESMGSQSNIQVSSDCQGVQTRVTMTTTSSHPPGQTSISTALTSEPDDMTTDYSTQNVSVTFDHNSSTVSKHSAGHNVAMTMVEDKQGQMMPVEVVYSMDEYMNRKKKYPVADFRTKEKFFACNFCTMKFTKLINLYKHVNLQHNYQAPTGELSCVICDYKSSSKKNLLVHMRKHNPQECSETVGPDGRLYRCMSCQYTGTQSEVHKHMQQKKMVLEDGGEVTLVLACTVLSEDQEALGETTEEAGPVIQGAEPAAQWAGPASQGVESLSQWVEPVSEGVESVSEGVEQEVVIDNSRTVLLQVDPDTSPVPIQVSVADTEGSQSIVNRPQFHLDRPKSIIDRSQSVVDKPQFLAHADQSIVHVESEEAIQQLQMIEQQEVDSSENTEQAEAAKVTPSLDPSDSTVQMAAEQLMELSSGDFIEINGETYKVEFSNGEAVTQTGKAL